MNLVFDKNSSLGGGEGEILGGVVEGIVHTPFYLR